jgi:hypothetical protein
MQEVVLLILFFCSLYKCTIVQNTKHREMQRRLVNPMALFVISQYPCKQTNTKCNKFVPSFMLLLRLNDPQLTQAKICANPLISLVLRGNTELESLILVKKLQGSLFLALSIYKRTENMPMFANCRP